MKTIFPGSLILSALLFLTLPFTQSQEPAQSGVSTAGTFKPVKDSLSRPITAGGFVDEAPVYFSDVTARAGLNKFRHISGIKDKRYIIESPSGGVALFDYDNDGWLDIYLVNGSTLAALQGKETPPNAALFHSNTEGTYTKANAKADIANKG